MRVNKKQNHNKCRHMNGGFIKQKVVDSNLKKLTEDFTRIYMTKQTPAKKFVLKL